VANLNGGSHNTLTVIKKLLWNALKRSEGIRSKVDARNEFIIPDDILEKLGDRTIIFNNQINRVDIEMHQDIYNAIEKIDELELKYLKQDVSLDCFIECAYSMGIPLSELLQRIETKYLEKAISESKTKSDAARKIGVGRTTLLSKMKKLDYNPIEEVDD
jgi:DNA-binding NtrC family response regulator